MATSVIPENGQTYVAGDYEVKPADRLYDMTGPKCNGKVGQPGCGKPYKQCTCEKVETLEQLGNPMGDTPQAQQTNSLVMIAGYLGEIVKYLKAKTLEAKPATDQVTTSDSVFTELPPLVLLDPPIPIGPQEITPEKLAQNEAKKAATLERLKGAK